MSNAAQFDAFLKQKARHLSAPRLADEIREAIARWFYGNSNAAEDREHILGALAGVIVDQVLQDPDPKIQMETADRVLASILRAVKRESVRRRIGGIQVKLVKQ